MVCFEWFDGCPRKKNIISIGFMVFSIYRAAMLLTTGFSINIVISIDMM